MSYRVTASVRADIGAGLGEFIKAWEQFLVAVKAHEPKATLAVGEGERRGRKPKLVHDASPNVSAAD